MSRPLVLVLILAVAVAAAIAIAVRRPAPQSTAVAVRDSILTAPALSPAATSRSVKQQPRHAARAAQATAEPPATAEPSATAAPVVVTPAPATATSSPTPLPTTAARPVPAQTKVPVLAAPPSATVPRLDAEAPPKILSVALSNQVIAAGEVVNGHVETTSNVASVEASIAGYVAPLQKTGVGRFELAYRVPSLPFFLRHRTYTISIIAHNVRGDSIQTSVPVTIR